jgi:hypothetical protein
MTSSVKGKIAGIKTSSVKEGSKDEEKVEKQESGEDIMTTSVRDKIANLQTPAAKPANKHEDSKAEKKEEDSPISLLKTSGKSGAGDQGEAEATTSIRDKIANFQTSSTKPAATRLEKHDSGSSSEGSPLKQPVRDIKADKHESRIPEFVKKESRVPEMNRFKSPSKEEADGEKAKLAPKEDKPAMKGEGMTLPNREEIAKTLEHELSKSALKMQSGAKLGPSVSPKPQRASAIPTSLETRDSQDSGVKVSSGSSSSRESPEDGAGTAGATSGNIFALIDPTVKDKGCDGGKSKIPVRACKFDRT